MSHRENTSLAMRDKPKISYTDHQTTSNSSNSTKKKLQRKATTAPAQTSRAKRQTRVTNAAKLDDLRKVKAGRTNQTDQDDRRTALSKDEWAASVQPYVVKCKGCQKPIKLDVRYGQYYRSNWTKHKKLCKKINEARKKKEARITEPKESDDINLCLDMNMDSDSQSTTQPGVTRNDISHAMGTSTPEAASISTLVPNDAKNEKTPSDKFVENPFKDVKESVGGIPPYLTYKFARYTSRTVAMLDQATVDLLVAHGEHLRREHRD